MPKLSIVLPSRDEKFLVPTIHDIFRNAKGETEVIAVIDSDKWPDNWKSVTDQYPNLHTVFHGQSLGMRRAINDGVASAISRGAKFIAKFDAHCSFSEGFDVTLTAECDRDWIVVPRRGRLDPENWCATETHKPDIDYHYLSFPDNPDDWGGPGLNGKPWDARAKERAQYELDEEMSSQGSGWLMHADYFQRLELMDETHYGPFWNEFQELGLKCWLSGGRVMVNKKARYLHLHKGRKYGRGYRLAESALQQGAGYTRKWIWNEAWSKQTLPFTWLIEHFWPVPSWPTNWEEILYATRKPRLIGVSETVGTMEPASGNGDIEPLRQPESTGLTIHNARYGIANPSSPFQWGQNSIDVADRVRALIKNNSLDVVVNNSTLTPNQNPFRGKKKVLLLTYSIDGGEQVTVERKEKDWLIIGPVGQQSPDLKIHTTEPVILDERFDEAKWQEVKDGDKKFCPYCGRLLPLSGGRFPSHVDSVERELREVNPVLCKGSGKEYKVVTTVNEKSIPNLWPKSISHPPQTAAALNDYLIRKFSISPQRLRGPMPIELRDFHRNDLAQLFAELKFCKGVEVGVAEGNFSEVLLKADTHLDLRLVDPWHHYGGNPQGKSKDRHEFAYNETVRKTQGYPYVTLDARYSMDAVRDVPENNLDFCYIDGNHLFDYVMQDLIEWSKRVRSGGIVSGDDYYALDQKRWVGGGVVEAVQAYTNAHRIPIWYLFAGHKSVDFMWVKP